MDTHKLDLVIGAFLQKRKANISYYEENWGDRLKREAYYQSFTKEKILMMTEDDFFEYITINEQIVKTAQGTSKKENCSVANRNLSRFL